MKKQEKEMLINEQQTIIANLRNNLNETDYKVIKAKEQDTELDADFKAERQGWRDAINAAEAEIARLEAIEVDDETEGMHAEM